MRAWRTALLVFVLGIAGSAYLLFPRLVQRRSERDIVPAPGPAITPDRREPPAEIVRAAESGDSDSQYRLGLMYLSGEGISFDHAPALSWFKKAAEQGHPDAQYKLAAALATGDGVGADLVESYAWYVLAQSNGNTEAAEAIRSLTSRLTVSEIAQVRFRVGEMYAHAEGTRMDSVSAYAWLDLAESAGHPRARIEKAQLAKRMSVQQLAEASKRASSWLARHRSP